MKSQVIWFRGKSERAREFHYFNESCQKAEGNYIGTRELHGIDRIGDTNWQLQLLFYRNHMKGAGRIEHCKFHSYRLTLMGAIGYDDLKLELSPVHCGDETIYLLALC